MGARVDEPNKKGDTALHVAAREERVEVVPLLLKLGANPGAKNAKGQTPLGVVPKKGAAYSNSVRREAVIAALKTAK
jgi:ankyrin repeat protein